MRQQHLPNKTAPSSVPTPANISMTVRAALDYLGCYTNIGRSRYFGLGEAGVTPTDDACRAKCCAAGSAKCNVWLRAEVQEAKADGTYPAGSCFIGIAAGGSVSSPVWSGERLGKDPPPPPPPPPPVQPPTDLSQRYSPVPSGSKPLRVVDLASTSAWTVSIDGSATRSITVPGGGYNSDLQPKPWIDGYNAVYDNVTYSRKLSGLKSWSGGVLLEFGGVAHGAEVFLAPAGVECRGPAVKVAQHFGPMMPFAAELTAVLAQHSSCDDYEVTVVAHHFRKLSGVLGVGFIYNEAWKNPAHNTHNSQWQSRNAFGITKSVRLARYGSIMVSDIVTHTSVKSETFGYDAVLRNFGTEPQEFTVSAKITAWGAAAASEAAPAFPSIPTQTVRVPGGSNATISVKDVAWTLGNASYWWPNKPFRENYVPKLQILTLTVAPKEGAAVPGTTTSAERRFGFVEWAEAAGNGTWYTVNGRRINFISDATPEAAMSTYDCYTTSPAFNTLEGAKETWRRYMRIGMSANRIHQSTPTQIMLDAADEVGFCIQPETAIRGECPVNKITGELPHGYTDQVVELAHVSRAHPSVWSYSLQNECDPASIPALLDAIATVDTDRPFVWNDNKEVAPTRKAGKKDPSQHAYAMLHYRDLGCSQYHEFAGGICAKQSIITGLGECAWCVDEGLESFAAIAVNSRQFDISYIAGWDWINYWPNFLEGMNYTQHAWKQTACVNPDRKYGIDGWNSSVIDWTQRAFHPYLVFDVESYRANPRFTKGWPAANVSSGKPGATVSRAESMTRSIRPIEQAFGELVIFNDVTDIPANNFTLRWSGQWELSGPAAVSGSVPGIEIEAGFHARTELSIKLPTPPMDLLGESSLQLTIELVDSRGVVVFTEDRVHILVLSLVYQQGLKTVL